MQWRLTTGREEGLEQGSGIGGENAGGYVNAVIEFGGSEYLETGTEGTAFRVVGSIYQARNAGLNDGASAHRAGLEGDVEGGIGEAIVAESVRGCANRDDFGVGGGIVVADGAIAGACKDFFTLNEYGADGHLASLGGGAGFVEGKLHEVEVVGHWWVEDNTALTN